MTGRIGKNSYLDAATLIEIKYLKMLLSASDIGKATANGL